MATKPEEDDDLHEALEGETIGMDLEDEDVVENEDGSAVIRLDDEQDLNRNLKHFANIVDEVDQTDLGKIASDLLDKIERDKEARSKRDKLYEEGLRRTGLGDDAPGGAQFSGANKVVHPMLVEACVDFSARVMKEMFPPNGPVKTKVLGEKEKDKMEKAERKAAYMNWQLTEQIPEFRGELEQLTTQVPLGGAQYMKAMWNPQYKRPGFEFIPIDDIYLPFAATNFYTSERRTHVQYLTSYEYDRRVKAGMYTDVDFQISPEMPEFSAASHANDKIEGREEGSYNEDGLRIIFEVYTQLDLEGELKPYIISLDKHTGKALALYRNWEEEDTQYRELEWIVEFPFVPWRGAYPIGLTHMIGGLSGSATGALRALLDSSHIQNMPTLLKLKGGPDGQTLNLQPTEVAEIDGGSLVDDIRKLVMAVPFNQPSPVLFQLLGFLIDAGKGVVQTSFEKLSDQNPNAPVGTTLALIEQGMVVFSSIHSRLHNSMGRLFKILHRINSAYLTEEDIQLQGSGLEIQPSDFDGAMDVIPVSDPMIFTEAQRFAQVQAILQRSALMPQMYNVRKVEEMFVRSLKLSDDVLAPSVGEDDIDPVSENVAASMGRPVYVLPPQDHVVHLKTHLAFLQSPLFGMNPVIAKTYLLPMVQHLRDHILNYYMTEALRGVKMTKDNGAVDDDPNNELQVIAQVQQMIEQELAPLVQLLPQIAQEAQKYAPPPPAPDSSMAVAQLNAQLQEKLAAQRTQIDQAKLQLEQMKAQQSAQTAAQKPQLEMQKTQLDMQKEQMRQQAENQRLQAELQARMMMNREDNETALQIVAAEIETGERSALSTGTGINP